MPSKHEIRISYSTLTEESVSDGDHAGNGWIDTDEMRSEERVSWGLRDAVKFMFDRNSSIETCGIPGADHSWYSGTGNTSDCEDDEIEVCYDLHVKHVSDGTAMRLARVMASNGVYFANCRELQLLRRKAS